MRQSILVLALSLSAAVPVAAQTASLPPSAQSPQAPTAAQPAARHLQVSGSTSAAAPSRVRPYRRIVRRPPLSPAQVAQLMGQAIAKTHGEMPEQAWAEIQKLNSKHPGITQRYEQQLRSKLKQQPDDGETLYALGMLQLIAADYARAVKTLVQAASVRPNDPYVLAYHGFALLELGSPASAAKSLNAALGIKPGYRYARWLLAQTYYRRGDRQQAVKLLLQSDHRDHPAASHS